MNTIPESSFFKNRHAGDLPTPAGVRAINIASGHPRASYFNRPPPVRIPSLGLLVKYGADVFIYMSLVEGETLQERWGDMDESERRGVCAELRSMVKAWRALQQDSEQPYIGSVGEQPLNDIFLACHPELTGPFQGDNAAQEFQDACGIDIANGTAIVFTHDDLVAPNIILSPGPKPRVKAVIDWAQAGWYPAYWEFCKARRVRLDPECFSDVMQHEWQQKYLPMMIDPVDDASYYHPWLYFVLSKGI
ncbi:hypothetical protein SODALDRAFT_338227 [Sodiomyces alkalinus F11]|uniref:Aminoglycoside phosphotransferase domain-containing protein n=1 Tax=Sodiomyces alkalinus (strain CBS 110278 / VKM F-3762 / F11) TaxID=1314773 RepID=A0A3N2Q0Z5_SODAK|nr:hypothetical protein SODALDRAFT_338227 [Sodiomyces alkalinus F11]ROT40434.1 hypothetical protein SODALDRAFT_338227 [Sodiomyces alkalinus F11]